MAISALLLCSLLAIGPDWAIVDLPYPEVPPHGDNPTPEQQVAEAAAAHVKSRDPKRGNRKLLMSHLRIEGNKAWVRVTDGDRTETVWLVMRDGAWRVQK